MARETRETAPPKRGVGRVRYARRVLGGLSFLLFAASAPDSRSAGQQANIAPGDDPATLDAMVGWYRLPGDDYRLATWGATGGLKFYRLDGIGHRDDIRSERLAWSAGDGWVWRRRDLPAVPVEFESGPAGRVTGFRWTDDTGRIARAVRDDDYGYDNELARFANGDVKLVGTLHVPRTSQPHPAAVIIHGSGDSHRDNYWYMHQVHHLVRAGVAVLFPDKRGCGHSGGEWQTAGFDDFAGDTRAGLAWLRKHPLVDAERVGVIGISQGGWIAPLVATTTEVAFVVNVSGAAVTPGDQLHHEVYRDIRNKHIPPPLANLLAPGFARIARSKRKVWWEKNKDFDPIPLWERVEAPVLILYGEQDEHDNVPVRRSVERLEPIENHPDNDFTVTVFDNVGHGMISERTGWILPAYLESLVSWVDDRAAAD